MKRLLSCFILLSLLLNMIGSVFAQDFLNGFQFRVEKNGNVTIIGYIGTNTEINIPNEINGSPVTEIGNGAFMQTETIKHVIIPEGISKIGMVLLVITKI